MLPTGESSMPLRSFAVARSVLVVDDSMLARHSISRLLEKRGFAVESVSGGQEALDRLVNYRPNLIVTDMKMPGMNGGELIEIGRASCRERGEGWGADGVGKEK